ncbi:two-component sensor histidine kinase [Colwellia sp. 75C3]|uniref:ATP-binding protein n=1 Tax=Colwellia sp. 75C3 TaxID=888425 RepID=UPI000C322BF2|nr:ATP-binding protein [Colwellia sp. 75C3]PKG82136.1 two-component sensor histidine kinase [Colwellia sp. 75C3]
MKIQNKLFLFLFGFSLTLVTVLVLLMQWSIGKGMVEYVVSKEIETFKPIMSKLSQVYKVESNWRSMTGDHAKFRRLISQQLDGSDFDDAQRKRDPEHRRLRKQDGMSPPLKHNRPPSRNDFNGRNPPKRESHYALLDIDEKLIVGNYHQSLEYVKTPVKLNNSIIGFFAISKRNQLTQGYEVDFIEQQRHYLWLIALFVMGLVALVTFPLARHVVEPIKLITRGMHKLTQGDYQQTIDLKRQDELGQLSRDYNELALTLTENESARKRWLANISHELRTPVAILRGELEAMLDKVRPLTLSNITSANDEVKHLQRLIDDLNLLTSADIGGMRYRKQHEDLVLLMQGETEKYRGYLADADISLTLEFSVQEVNIYADINRLVQLFENIINNCIKYSSATQLNISVKLDELTARQVIIVFDDDGVGVDDKHLSHLFEHLYRVEDSRNRKTGGSGLGLSICRHIVVAHQGEISAGHSMLGGLAIMIKLPLA